MIKHITVVFLLFVLTACSSNDDSPSEDQNNGETISSITEITAITNSSVTIKALSQGANVSEKGVVWSTSPNPTLDSAESANEGTGTGSYTSVLTNLNSDTQ